MSAYVGRLFTTLSSAFTDFNSATLSGAIDILVIEDDHGRRQSTPFHVRFGKLQLLKTRGIPVDIELNGTNTNLRMLLGAAGEAYFFNPNLHSSHLSPRFDLPAKAATQQLPNPSQIFATSSTPPTPPSVPSDFEPSCAAVTVLPSQVVPSDLVPSDHRFDYCSDSDVELTRAERDGTAHVAEATHSPPACMSQLADRKWSTAVTVSFSQFQLERSLAHPSSSPSAAAETPLPDEFSEALFDLPATPPSKRASPASRNTVPTSQPSLKDNVPLQPPSSSSTPARALPQAYIVPSSPLCSAPSSRTDAPVQSVAQLVSPSHNPVCNSAASVTSTTSATRDAQSVAQSIVSCQPQSTDVVVQNGLNEPARLAASDHQTSHQSLTQPLRSQQQRDEKLDDTLSAVHSEHTASSTSDSQSAQDEPTSTFQPLAHDEALPMPTMTPRTDQESPQVSLAEATAALVDTATQTPPLLTQSEQHVHFLADGERHNTPTDRKLNGKIKAQPERNQSHPTQGESHTHSELAARTNLKSVASKLANTTEAPQHVDTTSTDSKRDASAIDSATQSHSLQNFSDNDQRLEQSDGLVPMSLCGNLLTEHMTLDQSLNLFDEHRIPYEHFISSPEILYDPSLMFRIANRVVNFKIAAPYVFSAAAFRKQPDVDALTKRVVGEGDGNGNGNEEPPKAPPTTPARRFRWFSWSNTVADNSNAEEAKESAGGEEVASEDRGVNMVANFKLDSPAPARGKEQLGTQQEISEAVQTVAKEKDTHVSNQIEEKGLSEDADEQNDAHGEKLDAEERDIEERGIVGSGAEGRCAEESSAKEPNAKEPNAKEPNANEPDAKDPNAEEPTAGEPTAGEPTAGEPTAEEPTAEEPTAEEPITEEPSAEVPGMISFSDIDPNSLSLTPTPEQLMQLKLKPGPNTIRFVVRSSSVELNCRIFLWSCHTKIVISDVDGTITRSDVLGHLLPAVGRDWSQVGVAGLYSQIEKNGYKILYLTARPIGQASQTRAFLHSVTQGSAKLPNGPVLMSPNRLVESFAREVIRRRPHEFKIAALREVRSLFSPDYNPFHAGFGNRETDVISYRAVGLIPQRIFVVNTRGELAVMKARYESTSSYSSLQDLVENVFPDISGRTGSEMIRAITDTATFNDWKWWKGSLPEIDLDALLGE
eukprot:TRINITY_DN1004_c0_g1_i6.p1 TRINITY_DN1004_c0_g1~~TRINITY_DN1004_c0_g1_i6.p1  ORF type:complete len:1212 (-),score=214.84 TRINITY_DN1004_c0_g1_i6:8409-11891(-)